MGNLGGLHEPVRVLVDFAGQKVRPVAFQRGNRRFPIDRVNLVYRKRVGTRYVWCFAVSDAANAYFLVYDPESLMWTLEEVNEPEV